MGDEISEAVLPDFPGRLDGRVAIVTGGGSRGAGIGNGRAAALMLLKRGASVAIVDSNKGWALRTRELAGKLGEKTVVVEEDVSSRDGCESVVASTVEAFGRIDVLVNNVGVIGPYGSAVVTDESEWDTVMRVNVKSMMLMAKLCIPWMGEIGGGSIINISSTSGLEGGHPNLAYPTTKAAVVGLTRAMAAHHGSQRIRVNCVAPGFVYTPMVQARGMTEAVRQARIDRLLLPFEGVGWDVGMAVAWLASDEARWITGIVLPVDGGATAASKNKPSPE